MVLVERQRYEERIEYVEYNTIEEIVEVTGIGETITFKLNGNLFSIKRKEEDEREVIIGAGENIKFFCDEEEVIAYLKSF